MSVLVVPDGYIYVLAVAVMLAVQCFVVGFGVMPLRSKFFNKAYFEKHFPGDKEAAKKYRDGYPDMGSGHLAAKLPLDEWAQFNNAQRAHYNYLEGLTLIVLLVLVSGLQFPKVAFYLGLTYIVGRQIYSSGYRAAGASGRRLGVAIVDLAVIALTVIAAYTVYSLGGGVSGLIKFANPF